MISFGRVPSVPESFQDEDLQHQSQGVPRIVVVSGDHFFEAICSESMGGRKRCPLHDPLIKPSVQFDRHLFWSNFSVDFRRVGIPHKGNVARMTLTQLEKWSGMSIKRIPGVKPIRLLRNVVHPLMGQRIFSTAKRVWKRRKERGEKGILTLAPKGFGL